MVIHFIVLRLIGVLQSATVLAIVVPDTVMTNNLDCRHWTLNPAIGTSRWIDCRVLWGTVSRRICPEYDSHLAIVVPCELEPSTSTANLALLQRLVAVGCHVKRIRSAKYGSGEDLHEPISEHDFELDTRSTLAINLTGFPEFQSTEF